jgi:hypothetical protein
LDYTQIDYSLPGPYLLSGSNIQMQLTPPSIPCNCLTFKKKGISGFSIKIDKSKLLSLDEGFYKIKVSYFNTEPGALWKEKNYEITMDI